MGHIAFTNSHDLLAALAASMNIISPIVEGHHEQVAYLSYHIACELGLSGLDHELTVLAALLHDVGAIFTEKPKNTLDFEANAAQLARVGADIMKGLETFGDVGEIIRYSQQSWDPDCAPHDVPEAFLVCSSVVHLADRVSICLNDREPALNQMPRVMRLVKAGRGTEFCPNVVDAFLRVADKPYVWMDLVYHPMNLIDFVGEAHPVSLEETVRVTRLMSRLIDFRSPFTAMHSAGVRASAVRLAELMGMSEDECLMMGIAGDLHDIGKIHVPREILEKPGKLTDEEFNVIQEHAYYTYQILHPIQGFEQICQWAAFHHEKLNGRGYPFRLADRQVPLGARIMAVADIFSAITEERPYRKGMQRNAVERIMRENVERGETCGMVTSVLLDHYDDVNVARDLASHEAGGRYFDAIEKARLLA